MALITPAGLLPRGTYVSWLSQWYFVHRALEWHLARLRAVVPPLASAAEHGRERLGRCCAGAIEAAERAVPEAHVAQEAERAGLVSRVVPVAKLMEEAMAVAEKIAGYSLPVAMMIKESVNRAYETSLAEGVLYERRHTKEIAAFGGIAHVMPVYATITLIIFLASMGLPLLNGFIGEAMILLGAYAANKVWAYWAVSGIVIGAAYLLWLYQRVFWGPVIHEENRNLPDLNARELATLVPLVVLCFWIGVYPKPFLEFLHRPMGQLAASIQPARFLGSGGGALHAAPRGSFPERNESVIVQPAPGTEVAPVAPPERSESVVVEPSPR